jgi:glutamine synthetase
MKPKDVFELARKHEVKFIDLKFIDFPGVWQHTTIPAQRLDDTLFEDGIGFDGSSIRGWQPINASDMLLIPDPESAKIDPFHQYPTLSMVCSIFDPITKQAYSRDPRHIAKKAEAYLRQTGIADTCFMGPEAEFFVFDDVRFDHSQPNCGYYYLDSIEGAWNSGREEFPNLGY